MRTCVCLLFFSLLCPGGCPTYNFHLKTPELQPSEFGDNFKVAAQLSSELNHDLLRIQMGDNQIELDPKLNTGNNKIELNNDMAKENGNGMRRHAKEEKTAKVQNFVGTNLFDANRKKCFSAEDVALLSARRDFELLIPKDLPQCLLSDEMVSVIMQYFHSGSKIIKSASDEGSKRLIEKAFYDTLGGYLRYYVVPVTKLSFYAGKVKLKTVENVVTLYQQCKAFLNTNGNGWKAPMSNVLHELKNVHIEPLKVSTEKNGDEPSCCANLDLSSVNNDAEDEQMIVSLPKLDAEDADGYLINVWLPFKRKRTFNLKSSKSAFIVVKFYETVTRCYRFQRICQDTYNRKFKEWILENIQVHLSDEQFYPGLGAILRIYENLRRGKKSAILIDDTKIKAINEYDDDNDDDEENNKNFNSDDCDVEKTEEDDDDILTKQNQQRGALDDSLNEPKKCKPKPKCKPKLKPKCKPKTSSNANKSKLDMLHKFFTSARQKKILKYLGILLALILLILLLILLICLIMRCVKKRKNKNNKTRKDDGLGGSTSVTSAAKKKGCLRFCPPFCFKKKGADEEILIKPESKSIVTSKPIRQTSSTSSVACRPKSKCLPCPLRGRRKSEPAIIETTSLDCSSSEAESSNSKKCKQKLTTVNEKKQKLVKSKKANSTPDSSDNSPVRKGLFRRKKSPDNVKSKDSNLFKDSNSTKESKSSRRSITPEDSKTSNDNKYQNKEKKQSKRTNTMNKGNISSKDNDDDKLAKDRESPRILSTKSSKDSKIAQGKESPRSILSSKTSKDSKLTKDSESPRSNTSSKDNKDRSPKRSKSPKNTLSFKMPKEKRQKLTWEHVYNTLTDKKTSPRGRSKSSWETLFDT